MDIVATILVELGRCIMPTACGYLERHRNFKRDVDELRRKVRCLNDLKEDIEEQLKVKDPSKKNVRKQVKSWLQNVQEINKEMEAIEEKVEKVSYFHRASLVKLVHQKIEEVEKIPQPGSFPQDLVIDKPQPVGILSTETMVGEVDVMEEIQGYLRDSEVGIIGVYGIGGVGKTTIMKHIHNELLKKGGFEKVIWVTVSQSPNVVKLQGDIASKMNESLPEDGDELKRASALMDIMNTVKYVLILDDVWNEFALHRVGIPEQNGCKIVIISRSEDVCYHFCCHKIVKVQPLSRQESSNLFWKKVGPDIQESPTLKEISDCILDVCDGLPLAIAVVAGMLRGKEDTHEWRNALTELRKDVGVGEIYKCLEYSYYHLSDSMIQNCFLYCSLYPEDDDISRASVIENWICEGLLEEFESRAEKHDKGQTILNQLERNCLVEKRSGGCVKMHDLVRNMALLVKKGKFMVKANRGLKVIPRENEWTQDLEKVSLMYNDISCIPENMSPKCSMLSTLILENNRTLRQIPECFFANMPLLKVLNLSETGIEVLPNSICNLEKLTALILHGCEHLECMPSLAKLKALKKLDLCKAGLLEVPEGIEMLANLQYLDLCCPHLKELSTRMISNLSCLQYLCMYKFSTEETLRGEAATLELENFEGGFYDLKDFNCFVSKSKNFLERLKHYVLAVGGFEIQCFNHSLSFAYSCCFKKVILVKCKIRGEDDLVLPDDLQVLSVEDCDTVSDISTFMNNTTQLRSYCLKQCEGIEWVVSSSSFTFMNNLEQLFLWELDSLWELVKVEKTTASLALTISPYIFSKLKHLSVWYCSRMKKLFPCELLRGQGLQNLELIDVANCEEMEEIIGWEEEEEGNETTTTAVFTFPNLRGLRLQFLPKLKRICPERGVMVCDLLNCIVVYDCLKVKRIPLCLHNEPPIPYPALKEIVIHPKEWWESLEWDNPNAKNILLPFIIEAKHCVWPIDIPMYPKYWTMMPCPRATPLVWPSCTPYYIYSVPPTSQCQDPCVIM